MEQYTKKTLKSEYKLLKSSIPRIRNIKEMKGICCLSVRDIQLNTVLDKLLCYLEIPQQKIKPIEKYSLLRDTIMEDTSLSDDEKLELIQLF